MYCHDDDMVEGSTIALSCCIAGNWWLYSELQSQPLSRVPHYTIRALSRSTMTPPIQQQASLPNGFEKKYAILTEIGSQRQAKLLLAIHFLNYFKCVNNEESRKVLSNRSQELRGRNEHHWTAKPNMFWWANRC